MKSKIIILLLFCSFLSFGQSVPNTNTFSLQDVVNVVGGTSLTQAFSNSVDAYFDPTYKGSKDRLSNFRNYTIPSCVPPTVTTASITAILATSATGGGNVTSDGGCSVTARGVCWSTSTNPTISDSHTTDGSGTGSFTSSITVLTCGLTYYVRAYATNSAGTSYGSQVSFTTTTLNFASYNIYRWISTSCGIYDITSEATAKQAYLDWINPLCTKNSPSLAGYASRLESLSVGKQFYNQTVACQEENYTAWFMLTTGYVIEVSGGVITTVIAYPW